MGSDFFKIKVSFFFSQDSLKVPIYSNFSFINQFLVQDFNRKPMIPFGPTLEKGHGTWQFIVDTFSFHDLRIQGAGAVKIINLNFISTNFQKNSLFFQVIPISLHRVLTYLSYIWVVDFLINRVQDIDYISSLKINLTYLVNLKIETKSSSSSTVGIRSSYN